MRMHHRFVELRVRNRAVALHLHVADEAHAVDLGLQRTDAVGQRLGQHRHDEPREIHAGRTQLGLVVERCARAYVVGHVGDRHHQAETVAVGFAVDRVVEVLGVLAVDRHQRQRAQVDAAADHALLDVHRHRGSFVEHFLRELVRQVVAVDRGLDHQRRLEDVAQHGQHAADRRAVRVARRGDLADHQLAVLRVLAGIAGNLDVALDALVVGHHEADAVLDRESAHQARGAPFEHFDDDAGAAAACVDIGQTGEHAIAVHRLAHFGRRQKQVFPAAAVGAQEAEAFGIGDHRARDQIHALGRHQAATAVLQQLAFAQHRRDPLAERVGPVGFGQPELCGELFGRHRSVGVGEYLQDRFATGNRIGVARRLARGVGILEAPTARGCRWRRRRRGGLRRARAQCALQARIGHPRRQCRGAARAALAISLGAAGVGGAAVAGPLLRGTGRVAAAAALAGWFSHWRDGTASPAGGASTSCHPVYRRVEKRVDKRGAHRQHTRPDLPGWRNW